ncbi:molybdate ABC transporter permease subunit [Paenibacillus mucilaginosus]|uniref:Molybdenum transport system permease n=1 Tax=Paenibacillus mucilaginosus (strain KNP414) TaxID=1036673 RepID=F8FI02_PAEMK|nr:molybdate ABC transporter permease subunit [Paenibacillus mucilaginosus]AEI43344.1 molybdate ABC transporter, inner membrane subunit [Paenibacillus mucilaginosus KNP414]MCG7212105.1 molybdate ABC transporter permease subunit [Paenibacillus mucilaginosus]WDM24920.1 molybdate ABC transporter permease subunit [Paenibacillus mucilaginosus]
MELTNWTEFTAPILLSLKVSVVASVFVLLLGGGAAWVMARRSFPGKTWVETAILLPLVLPPTVVGFLLLMLLGKKSWIGQLSEFLFHRSIIFTWSAAVIASIVVAFPLVYQAMKPGFSAVNRDLEDAARSTGASEWQVLRHITLPLAWRSVVSAYILGFARGLGEFGATLMIAGNIPGQTQTLPTAIYIAVEAGSHTLAWYWAACIIAISFVMLLLANRRSTEK